MSTTPIKVRYRPEVEATSNGRLGKATVHALDEETGKVRHTDRADIASAAERQKFVNRVADALGVEEGHRDELRDDFEGHCNFLMDQRREQKAREEASAALPPPAPETPEAESERILAETPPDVIRAAKRMLRDPELIDWIREDIARLGVVGEGRLKATLYLIGSSRKLTSPLSGRIQGPSASGKSYPLEWVAQLFPPEDVILATQMTPQALFHMPPDSLRHKFIGGGERSRLEDDTRAEATRALREMISGIRLSKLMPVRVEGASSRRYSSSRKDSLPTSRPPRCRRSSTKTPIVASPCKLTSDRSKRGGCTRRWRRGTRATTTRPRWRRSSCATGPRSGSWRGSMWSSRSPSGWSR
jgi:hypothetical protein